MQPGACLLSMFVLHSRAPGLWLPHLHEQLTPCPFARSYVATMLHRGQDTCLAKILGVYQVRWCG